MYSFRRFSFLLALCLPALQAVPAQSLSSSSNPDATASATPNQDQGQQPAPTQGELSVQARIRARRAQRRAAAIHEVYDHLYEGYVGAGYLRFTPGATLQRVNMYDWDAGFTRYFSERLGVTLDSRGYYGTPFIEPIQLGTIYSGDSGLTKPAISHYGVLIGPTYRFYLQPKYSISARVMAGYARGDFTGDTNGEGTLGVLYPDGSTYAASASIFGEFNFAPNIGIRVAPEYYLTGFGSSQQNSLGFTAGIVYRFGKQ
jgi:hypothetical protein